MGELEWLLKESGITAEEWKAYEAIGQTGKLLGAIKKALGLSDQAIKDKVAAENARLDFEKRYQDEYLPQMRNVTSDAIKARADAAAATARAEAIAKQAKDYGLDIVPAEPNNPGNNPQQDPPRAPGSPTGMSQQDFDRFSRSQANAITKLNDLNAEHFQLFGSPLPDSQGLIDEVERQRTLGHKNYSLQNAWEAKYNVAAKRTEVAAAAEKAKIDAAVKTATEAAVKEERSKHSAHPGMRSGQPSRFSTINPAEAGNQKPWQIPNGQRKAAMQPWRDKSVAKIREFAA